MISKINFQTTRPVTMKQAEKKEVKSKLESKQYISSPNHDSAIGALDSYGKAIFNISSYINIKPLKPIDCTNIDAIKGERIYNSKNQLKLIKDETNDYVTKYHFSEDILNHVDYVEKIDKKTNKPILTQHCEHVDGKCVNTYVTKLNSETGKEEAFTCYEEGKLVYSGKNSVNKKGEEITVSKYYDSDGYSINMEAPNGNTRKYVHISEDKKNVRYTETKETKKGVFEKNIEFYNGLPFVLEESKRTAIPNLIALEPLLDSDLKSARKFDIDAWEDIVSKIDGEVTRYSNGNIESKKIEYDNEMIEVYYNTENKIEKIVAPDLEIKRDKDKIRIKENLGNGKEKETVSSKGGLRVYYNDNGFKKELFVDIKKQVPVYYSETKTVEGQKDHHKLYYFNELGLVDGISEY